MPLLHTERYACMPKTLCMKATIFHFNSKFPFFSLPDLNLMHCCTGIFQPLLQWGCCVPTESHDAVPVKLNGSIRTLFKTTDTQALQPPPHFCLAVFTLWIKSRSYSIRAGMLLWLWEQESYPGRPGGSSKTQYPCTVSCSVGTVWPLGIIFSHCLTKLAKSSFLYLCPNYHREFQKQLDT